MKSIAVVLRLLLGAALLFMGLNYFFGWMDGMGAMPEPALALLNALVASGFTMQLISALFILVGLMLITNFYAAFGLVLLAPITVYIVLFHIFLAPGQILFGLVLFVLNILVAFEYKAAYSNLFMRR